jgi:hypothetical protein
MYPAKASGIDHGLPLANIVEVAVVLRHHVGLAGALDCFDQPFTIRNGVGGGLFAEHVLACLQRHDGLLSMELDRGRYSDDIQVGSRHVIVVGEPHCLSNAMLVPQLIQDARSHVAERGDLHIRMGREGIDQPVAARQTDDSRFELAHSIPPVPVVKAKREDDENYRAKGRGVKREKARQDRRLLPPLASLADEQDRGRLRTISGVRTGGDYQV